MHCLISKMATHMHIDLEKIKHCALYPEDLAGNEKGKKANFEVKVTIHHLTFLIIILKLN